MKKDMRATRHRHYVFNVIRVTRFSLQQEQEKGGRFFFCLLRLYVCRSKRRQKGYGTKRKARHGNTQSDSAGWGSLCQNVSQGCAFVSAPHAQPWKIRFAASQLRFFLFL